MILLKLVAWCLSYYKPHECIPKGITARRFVLLSVCGWPGMKLCANSWGTQWGEDGYFRIARGVNESGIESLVVGVWMRVDAASQRRNTVFSGGRLHRHRHRRRRRRAVATAAAAAAAAAAGRRSHQWRPFYHIGRWRYMTMSDKKLREGYVLTTTLHKASVDDFRLLMTFTRSLHYITLHSHLWCANYNKKYCTVAYYKSH